MVSHEFLLEKDLQTACVRWARAEGWFARRFKAPGRRSHPDYLFARGGVVVFVEFKRSGNVPTALQFKEHCDMLAAGLTVVWVDNSDDFKAILAANQ
jgi:hypothetical protein